jgi:hypothetical protein
MDHFKGVSMARRASLSGTGLNIAAWLLSAGIVFACLAKSTASQILVGLCAGAAAITIADICLNRKLSVPGLESNANEGRFWLTNFAPLGLALTAMYRFELVDWQWPVLVAFGIGAPFAIMQAVHLRGCDASRGPTIFLALFLCFTGPGSLIWSSLQFANDLGHPKLIHTYRSNISDTHRQRGRHDTMYWVTFVDPPKIGNVRDFKVDRDTFDHLTSGDLACVNVWQGMLSIRWYRVEKCKPGK